jgi:hypothetical protein
MFIIERSADAIEFESVGEVKAVGSSTKISNYNFIDSEGLVIKSYYRLKALDINGKISYSEIIELNELKYEIQISPNPTDNGYLKFQCRNCEENTYYEIYDCAGNQILKGYTTIGNEIDVSNLTNGIYYLNLISNRNDLKKMFHVLWQ